MIYIWFIASSQSMNTCGTPENLGILTRTCSALIPYTNWWVKSDHVRASENVLGAPVREVDSESHERFARALIIAFECQNADTPEKGIHCVALAVRNALRTLPLRTPGHQENPHGH